MKLIKPSFEIEYITPDALRIIEAAARICYQSTPRENPEKFVKRLLKRGHMTPFEQASMRVRIVCDRGISHELVRHRLASINQESTRYVRYDGEMEFILPPWMLDVWLGDWSNRSEAWENRFGRRDEDWMQAPARFIWACEDAEMYYQQLLKLGWKPEQARSVLPNTLKTELVMTANLREWMHIFNLRCSETAHPQMQEIMIPLRDSAREMVPVIFD